MDSIAAAESGHLGLPLGAAEMGAVLFGQSMTFNPDDPQWVNRDRFVLSAGHGSMFLYSWLHLAGYDLPMEEVKNFRVKDSKTPGHPEFGWTPGVESTTGPLGQGVGNGVGMAAAAKLAGATLNTPEHSIIDHHVVDIPPTSSPKPRMKLLDAAEKAKKTLSPHGVAEANIYLECLMNDLDFNCKLTLEKFEELVQPLLDRLLDPVERALADSETASVFAASRTTSKFESLATTLTRAVAALLFRLSARR